MNELLSYRAFALASLRMLLRALQAQEKERNDWTSLFIDYVVWPQGALYTQA